MSLSVLFTRPVSAQKGQVDVRLVLGCAIAVLMVSMGIRHTFGLFMAPMTQELGWGREAFAFAIGLQNLVWGMMQPVAGGLGDRYGAHRVLMIGALLYGLGLLGMAWSTTPLQLSLTAGVLIGTAHACTTFSIMFGVIGRRLAPAQRSSAMGIVSAAGSFGQFLLLPVTQQMIFGLGWLETLLAFAALVLLILPLSRGLRETREEHLSGASTALGAVREAVRDRSFVLLTLGYFVCGFQVVFIGVHLPAYLKDMNLPLAVAPTALALIGLFNIVGCYTAGQLGNVMPLRLVLAGIYSLRSVVVTLFLVLPLSSVSVYIFASVMGVLWLSTVPPTNAIIAHRFGVRYLSLLSGLTFFSHQIGSFLGVWLGGVLYDRLGSYDLLWQGIIILGVVATLLHLPIDERELSPAAARGT